MKAKDAKTRLLDLLAGWEKHLDFEITQGIAGDDAANLRNDIADLYQEVGNLDENAHLDDYLERVKELVIHGSYL